MLIFSLFVAYPISAFHPDNLLFHSLDILKRLMISDTIANDKALTILDIQVSHGSKLFGSGRVQDLEDTWTVVDLDFFSVKVLDGGVILLHEVARDKLDRQCGLAHAPWPQDNYLELFHDLTHDHSCWKSLVNGRHMGDRINLQKGKKRSRNHCIFTFGSCLFADFNFLNFLSHLTSFTHSHRRLSPTLAEWLLKSEEDHSAKFEFESPPAQIFKAVSCHFSQYFCIILLLNIVIVVKKNYQCFALKS